MVLLLNMYIYFKEIQKSTDVTEIHLEAFQGFHKPIQI